jgi:hypothetical protein
MSSEFGMAGRTWNPHPHIPLKILEVSEVRPAGKYMVKIHPFYTESFTLGC